MRGRKITIIVTCKRGHRQTMELMVREPKEGDTRPSTDTVLYNICRTCSRSGDDVALDESLDFAAVWGS